MPHSRVCCEGAVAFYSCGGDLGPGGVSSLTTLVQSVNSMLPDGFAIRVTHAGRLSKGHDLPRMTPGLPCRRVPAGSEVVVGRHDPAGASDVHAALSAWEGPMEGEGIGITTASGDPDIYVSPFLRISPHPCACAACGTPPGIPPGALDFAFGSGGGGRSE